MKKKISREDLDDTSPATRAEVAHLGGLLTSRLDTMATDLEEFQQNTEDEFEEIRQTMATKAELQKVKDTQITILEIVQDIQIKIKPLIDIPERV